MASRRLHALAQLIEDVKAAQGLSDEDLSLRARRAGHQISKQWISSMRSEDQDPLKSIVPSTVRALAAALEVPVPRVVEVALQSAGLPTGKPEDWSVESAISADPDLPQASKRMLLHVLSANREDAARIEAEREAQQAHSAKVRSIDPPRTGKRAARDRPKKDT